MVNIIDDNQSSIMKMWKSIHLPQNVPFNFWPMLCVDFYKWTVCGIWSLLKGHLT